MRRRFDWLVLFPAVLACTTVETTVEHEAIPREHALESVSISSVEVGYAPALTLKQRVLALKYHPGEEVAAKVRQWAEETGMWGGAQSLSLQVHSIRLPSRSLGASEDRVTDTEGEDRLGAAVEIRKGDEVLHRMDIVRSRGEYSSTHVAQIFSSDRAMNDLIAEVAWQIVYELTPPGYDKQIIRLGYDEGVAPATVIAARRGILSYRDMLTVGNRLDQYPDDHRCGLALSLPAWMRNNGFPWEVKRKRRNYEECKERAREAAERR